MNLDLFTKKEDINHWLNKYHIKDYEIIQDTQYGYVVNANNVLLLNKDINFLRVK